MLAFLSVPVSVRGLLGQKYGGFLAHSNCPSNFLILTGTEISHLPARIQMLAKKLNESRVYWDKKNASPGQDNLAWIAIFETSFTKYDNEKSI